MEGNSATSLRSRSRKSRGPYGPRCEHCRKDRKKCLPGDPKDPNKRCERCQYKGRDCSERKRATSRSLVQDPMPVSQPASLLSPSIHTEHTATNICLGIIDFITIFQRIHDFMAQIDRALLRLQRDLCSDNSLVSLSFLRLQVSMRETRHVLIERFLSVYDSQRQYPGKLPPRVLQMIIQDKELLESSRDVLWQTSDQSLSGHVSLRMNSSDEKYDLEERGGGLAALDLQLSRLQLASMARGLPTEDIMKQAEKYDSMLKAFWAEISALGVQTGFSRFSEEPSFPVGIMEPFLHDTHFDTRIPGLNVESLIDTFESVNSRYVLGKDSLDRTLLHIAVEHFDLSCVSLLLKKGIDINAQDVFGRTALHVVCGASQEPSPWGLYQQVRQIKIVRILLEKEKLDIWVEDKYKRVAIDYAIQDQNSDILYLFKKSKHYYSDNDTQGMIDTAIWNLENCKISSNKWLYNWRDWHYKRKEWLNKRQCRQSGLATVP
ncbi:hypothetical protein F4810DRAFT_416134 [Camillea tinctor]|nr:hypothetical protein F4810DRAFT_416134 [Camillea tinctor]